MTTTAQHSTEQDQDERKGVFIPGAVWPDPRKIDATIDRRDPFTRTDRDSTLRKKHDTDLNDER